MCEHLRVVKPIDISSQMSVWLCAQTSPATRSQKRWQALLDLKASVFAGSKLDRRHLCVLLAIFGAVGLGILRLTCFAGNRTRPASSVYALCYLRRRRT